MVAHKRFMCINLRGVWSSDRNTNFIRYTRISVSTDIDEERFMVLKHTIGHLMVKFVYPAWVLFFLFYTQTLSTFQQLNAQNSN